MKIPAVLYRYMKADHALRMIKDPWIKITPPIQFNDFYELTPQPAKRVRSENFKDFLEEKGALRLMAVRLSRIFDKQIEPAHLQRIATKDPRFWREVVRFYVGRMRVGFASDFLRVASCTNGVVCFTENPLSHLMWNHYGDGGKGIVIGFSTQTRWFQELGVDKVRDHGKPPILSDGLDTRIRPARAIQKSKRRPYSYVNFLGGSRNLVYSKAATLQHEREWRACLLLALCRKRSKGMYFRRVPEMGSPEVIVGARCPESVIDRVVKATQTCLPHAEVKAIQLSPADFRMRFADVYGPNLHTDFLSTRKIARAWPLLSFKPLQL